MTETRVPAEVLHVTKFIEYELDVRGWTWDMLAVRMDGDPALNLLALDFLRMQNPNILFDEESAGQIAHAFGTSVELWLNIDRSWREHPTIVEGREENGDQP